MGQEQERNSFKCQPKICCGSTKQPWVVKHNQRNSYQGSFIREDLPVMQVYSQEKFVEDRDHDIRRIHTEAKEVHQLAGQINEKIYDQEDKLSGLNKDMSKQLDNVKESNKELEQAKILTSKRNKNLMLWTLFAAILAAIFGLSIYFMFFKESTPQQQ